MAATVARLFRYPVKSFQGVEVDALDVGPAGPADDRVWGVVDPSTDRVLSAKTVPALLDASARVEGDTVVLVLPDGLELEAGAGGTDDAVSAWLDREVVVRRAPEVEGSAYDMTFDPPNDDAEVVQIPTPSERFHDLFAVHALTTASLAALAEAGGGHDLDVRRFRPNVLVDVDGETGYVEDGWVGHDVALGALTIHVAKRTVRCAMPLRAQPGLARDADLFRTLSDAHENHLGVYCAVAEPGRVAVGDPVTVVGGGQGG